MLLTSGYVLIVSVRKLSNRDFYTLKFKSDFSKKKKNDILNLGWCLG